MAGAIDIMVVSQPDGSLRSSPFYGTRHDCPSCLQMTSSDELTCVPVPSVRFGKYTGLRTADKKVHLTVNGNSPLYPLLCTLYFCILLSALPCLLKDADTHSSEAGPLCRVNVTCCIAADVEADFTMHLGRSGEAYFVGEDDVVGECNACTKR